MKIRLFEHPLAPVAPREFERESLAEWLLDHYGPVPKVGVQIFAGVPSEATEISGDVEAILRGDAPVYTVLQSPGDPVTILTSVGMMLVNAVISMLTAPRRPPANVNRSQQSPNNALGERENRVRLLERVEDIYGTVKAIPSLMMPTYHKYLDHRRVEYGYYCVGRGYYDLAELRDGSTLIADISGASAAVYAPFTSPNSGAPVTQIGDPIIDRVLTAARSVEVDGITLKAGNQIQLQSPQAFSYISNPSGDRIEQDKPWPDVNTIAQAGQQINISMPFLEFTNTQAEGTTVSINAFSKVISVSAGGSALFAFVNVNSVITLTGVEPGNAGPFTVSEVISPNSIRVSDLGGTMISESSIPVGVTLTYTLRYFGVRTIAAVEPQALVLVGNEFTKNLIDISSTIEVFNGLDEWTDWVTLADEDRTEIWANVVAQQGMYKDGGGRSQATVAFEMQVERLDPVTLAPAGVVETTYGSLSGSVSDERAQTIEHVTAWIGPARVRMRRSTAFDYGFAGLVVDEVKWTDVYAVSPVATSHFGNKTTLHTITVATARATAVRNRQLNCIASRRLPIFDGTVFSGAFDADGRHVSGSISATTKMVNILAAICADPVIGARDLATEVDLAQIWGVQQQLDALHADAGKFSFTFDSDEMSFEETVQVVANACFATAYRQNGKIRMALDRAQTTSAALFTHRNKRPKAETITRTFATASEFDGVEFVYVDPDSNVSESFKLPSSAERPKKFEIPGIRSFAQAWLRANREYRKLTGQRVTIETETTTDARLLLPYTRVDIVDNTRFRSFDGEVVAQDGLTLTLSQRVEFTAGQPHSIVLMRRDGALESIACTPGAAAHQVVLQALPSEALVTARGDDDGVRTIYSFAADGARGAQAYLVHEIGVAEGQYVRLTAVNYSADYYAADTLPIPDKNTVIN